MLMPTKTLSGLVVRNFRVNIAMQIKTHFAPGVKRFEKTFRSILRFVRFFALSGTRISRFFVLFLDFWVSVK